MHGTPNANTITNLPEINELRESFARVGDGLDPLHQEYSMLQEAKSLNISLESYRRLYELKDEEIIPTYPKFQVQRWWTAPGEWSGWFARLPLQKRLFLLRKVVAKSIEKGVFIGAVLALGHYIIAIPARHKQDLEQHKQAQYQAWQTIDLAHGKPGEAGRMSAMQDLNRDHVPLEGINVDRAELSGISLYSADLKNASLQNTHLENSKLQTAQLTGAKLAGAIFRGADLKAANFNGADLNGAKFNGADLEQTNFSDARNFTPQQVTVAENWQFADYDADFLVTQLIPFLGAGGEKIHYALADFRFQSIKGENLSIRSGPRTEYYETQYSRGWKMLWNGASYVEVTFNLDDKPTQGSLLLRHVTSTDPLTDLGGYAPVDISINGNVPTQVNGEHIDQGPYNPAEHHDFTDSYSTDVFPITRFLHKGTNTIRVQLDKDAKTQYWIQTLLVHWAY